MNTQIVNIEDYFKGQSFSNNIDYTCFHSWYESSMDTLSSIISNDNEQIQTDDLADIWITFQAFYIILKNNLLDIVPFLRILSIYKPSIAQILYKNDNSFISIIRYIDLKNLDNLRNKIDYLTKVSICTEIDIPEKTLLAKIKHKSLSPGFPYILVSDSEKELIEKYFEPDIILKTKHMYKVGLIKIMAYIKRSDYYSDRDKNNGIMKYEMAEKTDFLEECIKVLPLSK